MVNTQHDAAIIELLQGARGRRRGAAGWPARRSIGSRGPAAAALSRRAIESRRRLHATLRRPPASYKTIHYIRRASLVHIGYDRHSHRAAARRAPHTVVVVPLAIQSSLAQLRFCTGDRMSQTVLLPLSADGPSLTHAAEK